MLFFNNFETYFQTVLRNVDSILYVDADALFLTPPEYLWGFFNQMSNVQLAALTTEHEATSNFSYYNKVSKVPYFGKTGSHIDK